MTVKAIWLDGHLCQSAPKNYEGKTFTINSSDTPVMVQPREQIPSGWVKKKASDFWGTAGGTQTCLLTIIINSELYLLFTGIGQHLTIDALTMGAVRLADTSLAKSGGVIKRTISQLRSLLGRLYRKAAIA